MPTFTYRGEAGRYYPTLALTPEPGGSYDVDEDPADGRWAPAPAKKAAKPAATAPDGD